jgi:hypothetical protein
MSILSKEEALEKLKQFWKTDTLVLEGKYTKSAKGDFGFFNDVVLKGSGNILIYPNKKDQASAFTKNIKNLTDEAYYEFKVEIAEDEFRKKNPYKLTIDESYSLKLLEYHLPSEGYINKLFYQKGGVDPDGVATIASQLSLNGLELYTETERFIFELLQNADDMPYLGEEVIVKFVMTENLFLFMHNGKPFTRKDVNAISDAARSNKTGDSKKTGYKGIGFKSVFTDSECVYIYSNGFQFRYDKEAVIYKKFDDLYKVYFNRMLPEEKERVRSEFNGRETEFEDVTNISWQIKPIWTEKKEFPNEISETFYKNNVAIALQIGKDVFRNKKYNSKVYNLFKEPRFLLFLRNIKAIYITLQKGQRIRVNKQVNHKNNLTEIKAENHQSNYAIQSFDINIDKNALEEVGIPIKITIKSHGEEREFRNEDGIIIKNIPNKLIQLEKTSIVFAAQVDNQNRITKAKNSILFNYLPTSDKNYEFPFLVNADFITKTDREFILKENLWNHYLFFHIGYNHVKWVASLASEERANSYLNVLVSKLKDENEKNSYHEINGYFNKGFQKAINEIPFVWTTINEVQKASEVIIDESRISDLFGVGLFYDLCDTEKYLIHPELNKNVIGKKVFQVDTFSRTQLCEILDTEVGQNVLKEWISGLGSVKYNNFLETINSQYLAYEEFRNIFNNLPVFRFGSEHHSINSILENEELLLINNKTIKINSTLSKLFIISDVNVSTLNEINSLCRERIPYFVSNKLLDKIELKTSKSNTLDKIERKQIFTTLKEIINDDERMARVNIFTNYNNEIKPLNEMIGHQHPEWLNQYKIGDEVIDDLDSFLIDKSIYSEIITSNWDSIITNSIINADTIKDFYEIIIAYCKDDEKPDKYVFSSDSEFKFIYTGTKFIGHVEVYYDEYLCDLNKEEFSIFNSILEKTNELLPPQFEILSVLKNSPFKIGNDNKSYIFDEVEKEKVRQNLTEKEIYQLFKYDKNKTANKAIFRNSNSEYLTLNELLPLLDSFVPLWLQSFQIHNDFKPYEKNLKPKMMTSSEVYEDIILEQWNIVTEDISDVIKERKAAISEVYQIITSFYNDNPNKIIREKLSISDKSRGFIYTNDEDGFVTNEDVFYNENYTIIEDYIGVLSEGILPHKMIITYLINEENDNLTSPFYSKDFEYGLLNNLKPESTFDLDADGAKALIEYCKKNDEALFNKGHFNEDFQFIIGDVKQYFIPKNQPKFAAYVLKYFSDILVHLPQGLSETTTSIGLLKGSNLYDNVIKNLEGKTIEYFELLDIIKEENLISEKHTTQTYLNKINRLDFKYDVEGKPNEFEVKYIKLYYESYKDKTDFQGKISELRDMIYIDDILLSEIEAKPQINVEQYRFEYNEIIKDSKDNTYLVDWLKKPFNRPLQDTIFTTNDEDIEDTYKIFCDAYKSKIIDINQFVFLLHYDVNNLSSFSGFKDNVKLIKDFYENNFKVSDEFKNHINWHNEVYPIDYAYDKESLSENLLIWINDDEKKVKYLNALGLNVLNSTVVKVRRYFTKEVIEFSEEETIEVLIARLKQNKVLLENTLHWLHSQDITFLEKADKVYLENLKAIYEGIRLENNHPILVYQLIEKNETRFGFVKNDVSKRFVEGFNSYGSSTTKINLLKAVTEGSEYLIDKDEFYRNINVPNEEKIKYETKLDESNVNFKHEWNSKIYKVSQAIELPIIIYPQSEKLRFWDTFNGLKIKLTGATRFYYRYKDNKPISENNEKTILLVHRDKLLNWSVLSEINLEATEKNILYAAEQFIIAREYLIGNNNVSDYNNLLEVLSPYQYLLKALIIRVVKSYVKENKAFRNEWLTDLKPIYDKLVWETTIPLLVYKEENSLIKHHFIPYNDSIKYYHGLNEADKNFKLPILKIIEDSGNIALPNKLFADFISYEQIVIEDTLDMEYLLDTRRSITNEHYYNQWSNRTKYNYQIYFINGNVRNKKIFLNCRLDDYSTSDGFIKINNDIYLSNSYENELEIILKDKGCILEGDFEELKQVKTNEYEKRNNELQAEVEQLRQAHFGQSEVIDDEKREVLTYDAYNFETGYLGEAFAYEELQKKGFKNVIWRNCVDESEQEWGFIEFNDSTYYIKDSREPYDLTFEDDEGNINYVQVKSTVTGFGKSDSIKFPISVNEWSFMENDTVREYYYLARVFDARSESPSLRLIKMIYQSL